MNDMDYWTNRVTQLQRQLGEAEHKLQILKDREERELERKRNVMVEVPKHLLDAMRCIVNSAPVLPTDKSLQAEGKYKRILERSGHTQGTYEVFQEANRILGELS